MDKKIITKLQCEQFQKELEELKTIKRPEIASRLQEAKAQGDLSENAEYSEAREAQSFLEGRIQALESMLSSAEIIDTEHGTCPTAVTVGTKVEIEMDGIQQEYEITGAEGADPLNFKISIESPMGQALQGKKARENAKFSTPSGEKMILVKKIHC